MQTCNDHEAPLDERWGYLRLGQESSWSTNKAQIWGRAAELWVTCWCPCDMVEKKAKLGERRYDFFQLGHKEVVIGNVKDENSDDEDDDDDDGGNYH